MADVNLELLTDEDIVDYSRANGRDHIITNHKDLNLQFDGIRPYPGGLYDAEIFGSPLTDSCICGKIRQVSNEPCPNCGCRVFGKEEALRRFARIELPFYYLNDLRFDIFMDLFEEIFEGVKIKLEFRDPDLKRLGYSSGRSTKKLGIKTFDTCQFEYSKAKNELLITEFITDEEKCSYEGLMKIIEKNFPGKLLAFRRLVNKYILVLPSAMRPYQARVINGSKKTTSHKLTIWYSIIAAFCIPEDTQANSVNYNDTINQYQTPGERVRYKALLKAMINAGKKQTTELLNTSKKNQSRQLLSVRVKNSARCPIVPSTTMRVDEIGIPVHVAYEMCREGFIQYLVRELNFTEREARKSTKYEAFDPHIQELFKKYAEDQYVLANRQPTLHEYGIYCLHLRITENNAIEYPVALCEPLNAKQHWCFKIPLNAGNSR